MFGDGDAPLPLADVRNVASAVATLVEADDPPSVVLHPSEGFTVRGLIRVMGGQPMSLPHTSGRLAVGILHVVGRRSSLAGATARRLELLVSGQGQDTTTLPDLGFAPAVSREAMARISRRRIPRILHVAASEYSVATLLLPQLRFLADLGFDVRVGCSPEGGTFRPALRAFRPIALGFPRALKPNRMAVAMCRFLLLVRRDTPDVVHLHSPAAALTVRLFPRWVLPRNTRIIYTVHGFKHTWEEPMSLGDRVLEFLERHQSQRTDALLFQSEEDFEEARRRRYGGQSVLLGNGVEEPWFEVPDPVRSGPLKLLFVGRLVREKGVLDLCAAVQRVTQDVVVAIAGGQPSSERNGVADLVAQAANAPETRGRIALFGHVTGDVLRDLIAEHDAVVLPSYREGLPRSVIEALAAGRPAIVTDIRGCRELVTDGVNGLIVPAGDLPALTAAIDRLAVLDADRFAAMSNAARESAANRHESQVVRRILRVYQTVGVTPPGDDDFDPLPAAQ
jgi:glycosyltransferase involved in cell wall biosynthesis